MVNGAVFVFLSIEYIHPNGFISRYYKKMFENIAYFLQFGSLLDTSVSINHNFALLLRLEYAPAHRYDTFGTIPLWHLAFSPTTLQLT